MKVLLIEDEVPIAKVIRRGLEQAHYLVDMKYNGSEGLEAAMQGEYDLILLDLMLPGIDGWEICQRLRAHRRRVPIMMLTARGSLPDRVRGLDTGADDYLAKPFEFDELLARIHALLRRDKMHRSRRIRIDDLEIDTTYFKVTRAGREIELSHREFVLLEALASREGQILSRSVIQGRVWMDEESVSNVVDVYIGQLRKKIDSGFTTKLIHTVRGLGYTLRRGGGDEE